MIRPARPGWPDGTFAEALFAVPPSGAGPPAVASVGVEDGPEVDLRSGTTSPPYLGHNDIQVPPRTRKRVDVSLAV